MKKIAVAITILIIILLGFFVYFNKKQNNLTLVKPQGAQPASTDIAGWKTYRNEKYNFELQYPSDWEALEQDNTIRADRAVNFPFLYKPTQFFSLYNVCFASLNRNEFYSCEVEIYISKDVTKFAPNKADFLGLPVVDTPEIIGGIMAKSYAEGQTIENIFIQKDGLIYLFTLPYATKDKLAQLRKLLSSFKFIEAAGDIIPPQAYNVTLYAYEKDGSHIFDGAVIAAIDTSSGKIVAEQTADRNGKVVFSLTSGKAYRFQPSPLHENRVVGSVSRYIPSPEPFITIPLTEVGPSAFGAPVNTCEEKHEAIQEILTTANYCETDADCQTINTNSYPNFECFYELNKNYQTGILFQRIKDYTVTPSCNDKPFNKLCPFKPTGRVVCVGGKGICARAK